MDATTDGDRLPGVAELREQASYSGEPWAAANGYFAAAEIGFEVIWGTMVLPFVEACDFSAVIDLAAGHGRNSRMLAEKASRLVVLDIQPENVEVCSRRFAALPHVECAVNDGYDMRPAEDGVFTFVYCFDSMVHFGKDVVRSYLRDTHRVLRPGGRGFFHHSDYTAGRDWRTNPHGRSFMSRELFVSYALAEGLRVLRQQPIAWGSPADPWGRIEQLDCLTLVEKV